MRPCVKCGEKPCLCEKKQAYTGDLMYFYSCLKCGYRTGYGVPGSRPNGITITTDQAIAIACQKWETGTTQDKEREEIRARFRSRGESREHG